MTDKELLFLAAKSAGIEWDDEFTLELWNPLESDGDALRLAVKLAIQVSPCSAHCNYAFAFTKYGQITEKFNKCPFETVRRAIVKAAAEIGSNK